MISFSLGHLIFHILITATVGGVNIKILQVNEISSVLQTNDFENQIEFVEQNKPSIILWFCDTKTNGTILHKYANYINTTTSTMTLIPVYGNDSIQSDCFNYSDANPDCYHLYSVGSQNVTFLVLNTDFWRTAKSSKSSSIQQIDWLNTTLKNFERRRKKVIIVGYDAPGSLESDYNSTKYDRKYNAWFVKLLHKYPLTVSACIFGGGSIDSFRIIMKDQSTPAIPIFIAPTISTQTQTSISSRRLYIYNVDKATIENYLQFYYETSVPGRSTRINRYNFQEIYGTENVHVNTLYKIAKSFADNSTYDKSVKYFEYQLKGVSFRVHCTGVTDHSLCAKCSSSCYILNLLTDNLNPCLLTCGTKAGRNYNPFFVVAVIIGFVFILVCIVFAVNKVYCFRRRTQHSLFLAPLTMNVQTDIIDDIVAPNFNGKLSMSKESVDSNPIPKTVNGHKRSSKGDCEQTYDYIRM